LVDISTGLNRVLPGRPGEPHSGSTIAGGLFPGMTRERAARFSFFLSMPAVFASSLLEFKESLKYIDSHDLLVLAVATGAAAISGCAAIASAVGSSGKRVPPVFFTRSREAAKKEKEENGGSEQGAG